MSANLLVDGPGMWTYHFALDEGKENRIGREKKSDLRLEDLGVSGNHAVLVKTAEGWLLRDLGASNGTLVNGKRIQECLLRDGDTIKIGDTYVVFQCRGAGAEREALDKTRAFLRNQETRIRDAIRESSGSHRIALPPLRETQPASGAAGSRTPAPAAPAPQAPLSQTPIQGIGEPPPGGGAAGGPESAALEFQESLWVAERLADVLGEMARGRETDKRQAYTLVLTKLREFMGADNGFLMIAEGDPAKWVIRAWVGDPKKWTAFGREHPISLTIANQAWTEDRPVSNAPGHKDAGPASPTMEKLQVRSYIAVPLRYGGAKAGLLYFDMRRLGESFKPRDVRLLERVGEYILGLEKQ